MSQRLSREGLKALLQTHVVELAFARRNHKLGFKGQNPYMRRMLGTLDALLLQSLPGRLTLNYQIPVHPPAYNPVEHNVIFTYDLMWQEFRAVPVESTFIIAAHPTHTQKDQEKFWRFFEAFLAKMSPQDKLRFMSK